MKQFKSTKRAERRGHLKTVKNRMGSGVTEVCLDAPNH